MMSSVMPAMSGYVNVNVLYVHCIASTKLTVSDFSTL